MIRARGKSILNFSFLVLCLKIKEPEILPAAPKTKADNKRVRSFTLQVRFMPFSLSNPYKKKVIMFHITYIDIITIIDLFPKTFSFIKY